LSELTETRKGKAVYSDETICEVHRTLTDVLVTRLKDRPEVLQEAMPHLNKAYLMGIRLVKALMDRKLELPGWAKTNVEQVAALRKERIKIVKELNEAGYSL